MGVLRCAQLYVLEIAYAICVDVIEHIMATMDIEAACASTLTRLSQLHVPLCHAVQPQWTSSTWPLQITGSVLVIRRSSMLALTSNDKQQSRNRRD